MNDLKQLTAITALNDMFERGHLNICTIDSVGQMLGVNPKGEAYDILRPLHCVNFSKMPVELRAQIPELIKQCLSVEPTFKFDMPTTRGPEPGTVQIIEAARPRRALSFFGKGK